MRLNLCSLLAWLALVLVFAGCGKTPVGVKINNSNVRRLRTAYMIYTGLHNMKGPRSEEELKEFLKSDLTAKVRLERIGVEVANVDDIFVSERDGLPFKVRYGLDGAADQAVVFEQEGVDDRRQIALWEVIEADSTQYDNYWNGKTKAKPDIGQSRKPK